jgi:hypothetical protein
MRDDCGNRHLAILTAVRNSSPVRWRPGRWICLPGDLEHPATFDLLTTPTDLQRRAFGLIDQITV